MRRQRRNDQAPPHAYVRQGRRGQSSRARDDRDAQRPRRLTVLSNPPTKFVNRSLACANSAGLPSPLTSAYDAVLLLRNPLPCARAAVHADLPCDYRCGIAALTSGGGITA